MHETVLHTIQLCVYVIVLDCTTGYYNPGKCGGVQHGMCDSSDISVSLTPRYVWNISDDRVETILS